MLHYYDALLSDHQQSTFGTVSIYPSGFNLGVFYCDAGFGIRDPGYAINIHNEKLSIEY
jgi:hypothetical protein